MALLPSSPRCAYRSTLARLSNRDRDEDEEQADQTAWKMLEVLEEEVEMRSDGLRVGALEGLVLRLVGSKFGSHATSSSIAPSPS